MDGPQVIISDILSNTFFRKAMVASNMGVSDAAGAEYYQLGLLCNMTAPRKQPVATAIMPLFMSSERLERLRVTLEDVVLGFMHFTSDNVSRGFRAANDAKAIDTFFGDRLSSFHYGRLIPRKISPLAASRAIHTFSNMRIDINP